MQTLCTSPVCDHPSLSSNDHSCFALHALHPLHKICSSLNNHHAFFPFLLVPTKSNPSNHPSSERATKTPRATRRPQRRLAETSHPYIMAANTRRCTQKCPFCFDRHFIHREALEQHWRHSQQHGWCSMCEKLYRSRKALADHMKALHTHPIQPTEAETSTLQSLERPGMSSDVNPGSVDPHIENASEPDQEGPGWFIDGPSHGVEQNSTTDIPTPKAPGHLLCFGCDRPFHEYASMILHLEEGECVTTMSELARIAESTTYSKLYVVGKWREYLQTKYGLERGFFETDQESVWECTQCRLVFYSLNKANAHARSAAHKPKVFKCPSCSKKFKVLSGLLQHIEQSTSCPEGPYKGTRTMGKLLNEIGDRMSEKRRVEPERNVASSMDTENEKKRIEPESSSGSSTDIKNEKKRIKSENSPPSLMDME